MTVSLVACLISKLVTSSQLSVNSANWVPSLESTCKNILFAVSELETYRMNVDEGGSATQVCDGAIDGIEDVKGGTMVPTPELGKIDREIPVPDG